MDSLRRILRWFRPPRRLRLTREGRYFLAITVGIGLAAINTGNNLLYLLLGWLLSVIIASGVLSEMTLRSLYIQRRPPARIHAEQPLLMEISVENRKAKLASYSIEVEDMIAGTPLNKKCYFLKVPPGRVQRTSYRHAFPRRGRYAFSGFRVSTKFPFTLFRKSRDVTVPEDVLVLPVVYPLSVPPPRAQQAPGTDAQRIGRRGEFFGLREYREGDDQRSIHWRSTARTGRALVREYEEESQKRVSILLDNALPAPPGKRKRGESEAGESKAEDALERAISRAASLAAAYIRQHYAVQLVARGCHVPSSTGPAQLTRILEALALLPAATDEEEFSAAVDPRGESILVVPEGVGPLRGRPAMSQAEASQPEASRPAEGARAESTRAGA